MEAAEFKKFLEEDGKGLRECVTLLCCNSFDHNSTKSEIVIEGVTEGGVEKGDWKITIERINI